MQDVKSFQGQDFHTLKSRTEDTEQRRCLRVAFFLGFVTVFTLLGLVAQLFGSICALPSMLFDAAADQATFALARRAATPLLQVFQVYPPVLTPTSQDSALSYGSPQIPATLAHGTISGCVIEQVLMEHSFGYSYGMPFVGNKPRASPESIR